MPNTLLLQPRCDVFGSEKHRDLKPAIQVRLFRKVIARNAKISVRLRVARNRRRDLTVCLFATLTLQPCRYQSIPNMRVVEIVIDGFKSYAVRTVISGWDESFNSITGLNGSGKSNILDAICFVLGITSMSTVRAQNIQVSQLL